MKQTMKEAGITQKMMIDCIIDDFVKLYGISKAYATELFNEALAFNTVTAEIYDHMKDMIENPENRLDWSRSTK